MTNATTVAIRMSDTIAPDSSVMTFEIGSTCLAGSSFKSIFKSFINNVTSIDLHLFQLL